MTDRDPTTAPAGASSNPSADSLAASLAVALRAVLGAVEVSDLRRLTGGASRETWSFDAVAADGTVHELVLRRDPPGRPSDPGAMGLEARVMRAAAAAGLPVPEVLADTDEVGAWSAAGMVMHRVGGEALGRRILRDERFSAARPVLAAQCGAALAALHGIDPAVVGDRAPADPLGSMRAILDSLGESVPTFEVALRWLDRNRPASAGVSVVHGDFRLGNLMVDERGLVAVLDWELVHTGDPVEDLGWLCVRAWRFGEAAPVGGFGTREQLLDAYVAAGGSAVAPEVLRWWEVYGTLRWGAICLTQTAVHLRGDLRSVELAAIGRRVCETEWDLLLLLAPDAAGATAGRERTGRAPRADDLVGLHGRPTAVELVDAVREFLVERVMTGADPAVAFHGRVAANVLAMVGRELQAGREPLVRRAAALAGLGVDSEADLAAAVRSGSLVADDPEVLDVVADGVVERLSVANPRYLAAP